MLGINPHKLDEISSDNSSKASDCLGDVLKEWIGQNYNTQKYGVPSWKTFCKALSNAVSDQKFVKNLAGNHRGKYYCYYTSDFPHCLHALMYYPHVSTSRF